MKHLEIKHLRMICALAESGNMTRAAERLCITQSALSQQLKDIENKLGTDLFFRTRKKMIITEAGRQLHGTAAEVIETLDSAERAIARKMKGERGELRVGTQCIFCYKWLPRVMRRFQEKYPNIEIEVGNSTDLIAELEGKKFDMIISGAISSNEVHTSAPLFADQLVCVMPEGHPLAACSFVQFEDFAGVSLVSHADRVRNRFYQQVLKPRGIEPKKIMNVGAPQAIVEMVAAGFGITIFPRWALADALQTWRIAARPITPKGFPLTWHAVYLTHGNSPLYMQEFIRGISLLKVVEESAADDHPAGWVRDPSFYRKSR